VKERTIVRRQRSLTPAPRRARIALAAAIARDARDASVASLAGRDIVEGRFAQCLSRMWPRVARQSLRIRAVFKKAAPRVTMYTRSLAHARRKLLAKTR